jgi:hypothetical protein
MTEVLKLKNKNLWSIQAKSVLGYVNDVVARKTLEEELEVEGSAQSRISGYMYQAFQLSASGHYHEADFLLKRIIDLGNDSLERQNFDRIFRVRIMPDPDNPDTAYDDPNFRPTPKQLELERAWGTASISTDMAFAEWFLTKSFPLERFKNVAQFQERHYYLSREVKRLGSMEYPLYYFLLAESYGDALRFYSRQAKGKSSDVHPTDWRFARSMSRTLAVLAEYAAGSDQLFPLIKSAVEKRYERSRDWTHSDMDYSWKVRVVWAYLHGRHFSGVTELRPLLDGLRGY